ncbi:MAG: dephospho-CoA kinase [Clostridia bacterium]|nr:dephospho-CoA kinase [Clostridia bacterium]MDD4798020.1 dephospho-CoA kinase [Clostridia bacterium]
MLKIALTGKIGSGKSLAAAYLSDMGITVIDADLVARELSEVGKPVYKEICQHFGTEYLLADGNINRKKLGELIFCDEAQRLALNSITHDAICREIQNRLQVLEHNNHEIAFVEAALLAEAGMQQLFDAIWLITSPRKQIIDRLAIRDGLSYEQAQKRLRSQEIERDLMQLPVVVIENDGSEQAFKEKIISALTEAKSL